MFDNPRKIIEEAFNKGVKYMLNIGINYSEKIISIIDEYKSIYSSIGIHPHDAKDRNTEYIKRFINSQKIIAIGEIGLDFYRDYSPRDTQREIFIEQIAIAKEFKLPIILHCRNAHNELIEILRNERAYEVGGIMHCFSGDYRLAKEYIDMGFLISIAGNITFKKAQNLRDSLTKVPIEKVVIETDSPFLAPEPFRGKGNKPEYIIHTANKVAEIKGLSIDDVARITLENSKEILRIYDSERIGKIAYPIRDSLYLNITNRCTNSCIFCAKRDSYKVKGHYLKLRHEPTYEEVMKSIDDPDKYSETVFCGYGEPTLRLDLLIKVAKELKRRNARIRVNTDGLGNLFYNRNILKDFKGIIDSISISLNAESADKYNKICRPKFGEKAYYAVKDFIRIAKRYIPEVTATVVRLPDINIEECRKIVEDELKVKFRIREYNEVG
jgi:TatD DNase family protein